MATLTWLKRWFLLLLAVQIVMYPWRSMASGMHHAQLVHAHHLLSLQVGMLAMSTMVYGRLALNSRLNCRPLKDFQVRSCSTS